MFGMRVGFFVTGFGKFHGIDQNPTEQVVSALGEHLQQFPLPADVELIGTSIGHVSRTGTNTMLDRGMELVRDRAGEDTAIVFLHFGVNGGGLELQLERKGYNETTFNCPDEECVENAESTVVEKLKSATPHRLSAMTRSGDQPVMEKIEKDLELGAARRAIFDVDDLAAQLRTTGFQVSGSSDPGRFICNYCFYESLRRTSHHPRMVSLFW